MTDSWALCGGPGSRRYTWVFAGGGVGVGHLSAAPVMCQAPCQGLLTSWLDHHEHTLSALEEIDSTLPENGRLRGKSSYPGVQGLL